MKDSRIYSLVYSPESIFTFLCRAATLHLMHLMLSLCKARSMGWLRLVGSLKLEVSFEKEPYKRDDILQKRPIILRSLPTSRSHPI